MRLFDEQGNVSEVNIEDMICIKNNVMDRKTLFFNGEQFFHDATTINQLSLLYQFYGFHRIDKNKLINLSKAERFENGQLWVNGHTFQVSRRNIPIIQRLFDQFCLPIPSTNGKGAFDKI